MKSLFNLVKTAMLFLPFTLLFCAQNTPEFDAENAFKLLEKQVAFGPRNPGSEGHAKCAEWLFEQLESAADYTYKQPFTHHDPRQDTTINMVNIGASFNIKAKKRVLLCAHWDTRPMADKEQGAERSKPILGANDGASGVAVLLEIARVLQKNKPEIGVDIVLFDGEDYGPEGNLDEYFLGSKYFAKNKMAGYKPAYGILLDMVGDANLELPMEYNSMQFARPVMEKVWSVAEDLGYTQFKRKMGAVVNDDHIPLIEAGIQCIDIIDFAYPDNTNRYWHTMQDTPDKCSPTSLKVVGQTVLEVIFREEGFKQ